MEERLRILMLEDSEDDASLIERTLRKQHISFIKERVDSRKEYTEAITRFQPDVILSDHGLPGFNSMEALKICLRERPVPFILVTGTVSDEYAISCIHDGADDYILKSNLSRLPSAIRSALKKRKLEKLKREARHALRRQNHELVKVNTELDNFVYSVSHNLRGPLASVMGLLNLAHQESQINGFRSLHAMMSSSIKKLDDTLSEIVEFSKNARSEITARKIDWAGLINSGLHKLDYLDMDNKFSKVLHLHIDVPFFSDESRISTLLTIILSNAAQFSVTEREPMLGIEVITNEDESVLIVKDNGLGIPEDILPKVFDMFYRGTEKSRGAGLGLYIAREIVTKLQGSITIQSELNVGTTVTVRLPNIYTPR